MFGGRGAGVRVVEHRIRRRGGRGLGFYDRGGGLGFDDRGVSPGHGRLLRALA